MVRLENLLEHAPKELVLVRFCQQFKNDFMEIHQSIPYEVTTRGVFTPTKRLNVKYHTIKSVAGFRARSVSNSDVNRIVDSRLDPQMSVSYHGHLA